MSPTRAERIPDIQDLESLVEFFADELDWPVGSDSVVDIDECFFEYDADELGLKEEHAVHIQDIKQLRPLRKDQPWGVFWVEFDQKRLPITVLRRILRGLVTRNRTADASSPTWDMEDLLFISRYGAAEEWQLTFAHFSHSPESGSLPTLRVLGWDETDTRLRVEHVERELREKLRWPENESDIEAWRKTWSSAFVLKPREVIRTSRSLAVYLAKLAKRIRQRANEVMEIETEKGALRKLHATFKAALIHDLDEDGFADMYAQTIAYGLLAARVSRPAGVQSESVPALVPVTNPFLKEVLSTFLIAGGNDGRVDFDELGVQDIVDLLNSEDTHMEDILRDFGKKTQSEDPVIYFYEHFLSEYDRKKKMKRGIFFTPRPVVSFIVRSVHEILQTEFGLEDGLASTITWGEMAERNPEIKIPDGTSPDSHFVIILDPATGTGTFLVEVIEVIHRHLQGKWAAQGLSATEQAKLWNEYVPKHLLPRLYGFELMMAPYAVAHMKIGLKLTETGYNFLSDERLRVYLTNSLELPSDEKQMTFAEWSPALAHEARAVNEVKRGQRYTVVIGNPPYAGHSANKGEWITNLTRDYRRGYPDLEKPAQGKWLMDDYVKFIRLSHYLLIGTGVGVHSYISNNAYIDNPTFKGMRRRLSDDFQKLFILDLHGSRKKKEMAPDGSPDKNVFQIEQGVAIGIYTCNPGASVLVSKSDIWGSQEWKYGWLGSHSWLNTEREELQPCEPFYLFVKQSQEVGEEYKDGSGIHEVFSENGDPAPGIVTTHDEFAISWSRQEAADKIRALLNTSSETEARALFRLCSQSQWNYERAKSELSSGSWKKRIMPVLYRPFDERITVYDSNVAVHRRVRVMSHMLEGPNCGLITCRQLARDTDWAQVGVSRLIIESCAISNITKEINYLLPLYLYPAGRMFTEPGGGLNGRRPNLDEDILGAFSEKLGLDWIDDGMGGVTGDGESETLGPEDFFHYCYAVLHSRTYRERYKEFLRIDFPRLPLTSDVEMFRELCRRGADLVALHLLEDIYPAASWNLDPKDGLPFTSIEYECEGETERTLTVCCSDEEKRAAGITGKDSPLHRRITTFEGTGDCVVTTSSPGKMRSGNRVMINDKQYFDGVPDEVWDFHIGGYQVCNKWLKDRGPKKGQPGRKLTREDIDHYHRIVVAIKETIRLMREIDEVIDAHGGWPIK